MTCRSRTLLPAGAVLLAGAAILAAVPPAPGASVLPRVGDRVLVSEPQETREVVVRPGDTLWEIAERHLGDPYRWREILEANGRRVRDPRRLVPGTVLRLPAPAAREGGRVAGGTGSSAPDGSARDTVPRPRFEESAFSKPRERVIQLGGLEVGAETDPAVVSPSDFASAPFVLDPDSLRGTGRTVALLDGGDEEGDLPRMVRGHDRVLLELSGWPAEPGELYQAFHWGRRMEGHGVVVHPVAVLEVERVRGDTAEARVRARYDAYRVGDRVAPLPPFPDLRGTRLEEVESGARVRLAGLGRERPLMAPASPVFLAAGERAGLRVGDELVVLPGTGEAGTRVPEGARPLARLRVLRTTPGTATATVLSLRSPKLEQGASARVVGRRVVGGGTDGGGG